jgi:phospholipase/carboxylesterase
VTLHRIELPAAATPSRTLVLLHGFGADEHDLLPLAPELDPAFRALSLAAPIRLPWGGRAWFNLEQRGGGFHWDPAEVARGAAQALEAVERVAREDGAPPLLCGFSQGACMALLVALQRPELVRGVISFSGVAPDRAELELAPPARRRGLPVFVGHGLHDPLLPIAEGRRLRLLLEEAGCDVAFHEYQMAHQIIETELADARAWLSRLRSWPPQG